ncbi:MAG: hypothetical protein QOJ15_571 [Bradyrhizobium sp.]|jgi:hypothetical protein|nr:hypothetical protein [Bradyrhizobium sp.]
MRSILSAVLLCIGVCAPASAQVLDPYLPKSGIIVGQVMELGASAEHARIAEKMQRAIQQDTAWFKAYVIKAKPGEPLAYHAKLGITKAEYDILLHAKMSLTDKGPVSVKLATNTQGNLEFSADGLAAALNGVKLPPGQKSAETPYGSLAAFSEISQDDAQSATGRWKGVQWKKEDVPAVTLAMGRRESGDGILYYNVTPAANNPGQTLIVIYRLD